MLVRPVEMILIVAAGILIGVGHLLIGLSLFGIALVSLLATERVRRFLALFASRYWVR